MKRQGDTQEEEEESNFVFDFPKFPQEVSEIFLNTLNPFELYAVSIANKEIYTKSIYLWERWYDKDYYYRDRISKNPMWDYLSRYIVKHGNEK